MPCKIATRAFLSASNSWKAFFNWAAVSGFTQFLFFGRLIAIKCNLSCFSTKTNSKMTKHNIIKESYISILYSQCALKVTVYSLLPDNDLDIITLCVILCRVLIEEGNVLRWNVKVEYIIKI